MATLTAQIMVGDEHQWHGGITPTHFLYLSENDRPAWVLAPRRLFEDDPPGVTIRWIPSVDHMLEDALAMIVTHVLGWEPALAVVGELAQRRGEPVGLLSDLIPESLQRLRDAARTADFGNRKLVLTVLEESTVYQQLAALDRYRVDTVVCLPRSR